jgi:VanZ family protein
VGDSPRDNDTWQGQFRGLAIYHETLSGEQLALDYESWLNDSHPSEKPIRADSLYLFNERSGRLIRDHGKSGIDLQIPERYVIVRQVLLESPWRAFEPTWGYVEDLTINVLGFAPFGLTLYAFLFACGWKQGVGIPVVIVGLLTSLTIETLQSYLPTRDSDLTDVLTNTLGTWLGVYLFSLMLKLSYTHVQKA